MAGVAVVASESTQRGYVGAVSARGKPGVPLHLASASG